MKESKSSTAVTIREKIGSYYEVATVESPERKEGRDPVPVLTLASFKLYTL